MKQRQTNVDKTGLWKTIIRAEAHSLPTYPPYMQKVYGIGPSPRVDNSFYYTCASRTRKPPRKFRVKSGLIQKRLKYGKNISHGYMS